MMGRVALLHLLDPLRLGLVGEVRDAVDERVEAGRQQPRREGDAGAAEARAPIAPDGVAERRGGEGDRRQRRVECAEQHLQMIGILVMVVMDTLPCRGEDGAPEKSAAVTTPAKRKDGGKGNKGG